MSEKNSPAGAMRRQSVWTSWSLIAAIIVTVLGLGLWGYAAATRPAPGPAAASTTNADGVSGFSGSDPLAAPAAPSAPEPRLVDRASPAITRLGACFIAGFCVAYAFKKFVKVTAIIAGVLLIALFALQRTGVIDLEWAWLQDSIERSLAWIRGEAGAMKDFIMGYLPSAGSAMAGMVVGLRKG